MTLYSFWPPLALTTVLLCLVRLPLFSRLDTKDDRGVQRSASIDGLRGFLALGVFFHHAVMTHTFLEQGIWELPPSAYYTLLGQSGVSLFFMITGFLFWEKLLRASSQMSWRKLYIGRVFRIGPLYVAVTTIAMAVVFAKSGFELREPPAHVLFNVTKRVAGLGILGESEINGYPRPAMALLLGVVWTLRYEWVFYFSLPLLAFAAHGKRHLYWVLGTLIACLVIEPLHPTQPGILVTHFLLGMLAASLQKENALGDRQHLHGQLATAVAVVLLLALGRFSQAYGVPQTLLMGTFFLIVSSGNSLFGLLRSKTATRLGHASYGIYLSQGVVLTVAFSVRSVRTFALSGVWQYWSVIGMCELVLVLLAIAAHLYIERPFIQLGKERFG
jgi:peptidoglycan/LPS O-acetylase OafA/YrhL